MTIETLNKAFFLITCGRVGDRTGYQWFKNAQQHLEQREMNGTPATYVCKHSWINILFAMSLIYLYNQQNDVVYVLLNYWKFARSIISVSVNPEECIF